MEKKIKLSSMSCIAKANDIELQEVMENAVGSIEDLIKQFHTQGQAQKMLPMQKLLGLDKQLRSIRGSLKVEAEKKVQLEEHIEREKCKLSKLRDNPEYNNGIPEDIRKQITKLNDELKVRQESIDLLEGRLTNQIMGLKETLAKVLDKGVSLAEKIRMLFREQGIVVASVLMAIAMASSILVEALPSSSGSAQWEGCLCLRTKKMERMAQKQI